MARIQMNPQKKTTVEQVFDLYLSAVAAEGVADKSLSTYRQHFRSIAKRLDITTPIAALQSEDLERMVQQMRTEGLSPSSINSYTRTLKVFFSWCNRKGNLVWLLAVVGGGVLEHGWPPLIIITK